MTGNGIKKRLVGMQSLLCLLTYELDMDNVNEILN